MIKGREEGFSLVELIVVIAIMAVLVGVLAPAFLKYVEKSRKSADVSALDQIMDAAEAVATDLEYHVPAGAKFIVRIEDGLVTLTIPENDWMGADVAGSIEAEKRQLAEEDWFSTSNKGEPIYLKAKEFNVGEGSAVAEVMTDGTLSWALSGDDEIFIKIANYSKDFGKIFATATN